jgi:hypothetical protein
MIHLSALRLFRVPFLRAKVLQRQKAAFSESSHRPSNVCE